MAGTHNIISGLTISNYPAYTSLMSKKSLIEAEKSLAETNKAVAKCLLYLATDFF